MKLSAYFAANEAVTHQAMAAKVGCSREYIGMIASGERRPSLDIALKIEAATDGEVTPKDLMLPIERDSAPSAEAAAQ